MTFIEFFGLAALLTNLLGVYLLTRGREHRVLAWSACLLSSALWAFYAYYTDSVPVMAQAGAFGTLNVIGLWRARYVHEFDLHTPRNLAAWIDRKAAWSRQTFGPGTRTEGVLDHITSELDEIRAWPDDLEEWADVILLALDGASRQGGTGREILEELISKQEHNERRQWPDWRRQSPNARIEHVREESDDDDEGEVW